MTKTTTVSVAITLGKRRKTIERGKPNPDGLASRGRVSPAASDRLASKYRRVDYSLNHSVSEFRGSLSFAWPMPSVAGQSEATLELRLAALQRVLPDAPGNMSHFSATGWTA